MDAHRVASSLLSVVYLGAAYAAAGPSAALLLALPLALLVALVWHADSAATFTGQLGFTPLRRSSPAGAVRGLAWALLLVPFVAWLAGVVATP